MLKTLGAALGAALMIAAATTTAQAAGTISGAGATFPAPLYAKWAETYKAADRHGPELPGDRLGRRHQQINANTVDFGATDKPLKPDDLDAERPGAVPDRDRRRGAGDQPAGDQAGPAQADRRAARRHLPRRDQEVERPDPGQGQPGRGPAQPADHRRAPLRRLGHHLPLHHLPDRQGRRTGRARSAPTTRCNGRSAWAARATTASRPS